MPRLNKALILKMLRESNCIETYVLSRYFESVWVGEEMRERIERAKRKLKT
jgi:hypothetical protein